MSSPLFGHGILGLPCWVDLTMLIVTPILTLVQYWAFEDKVGGARQALYRSVGAIVLGLFVGWLYPLLIIVAGIVATVAVIIFLLNSLIRVKNSVAWPPQHAD